jgi:hypothetical protein
MATMAQVMKEQKFWDKIGWLFIVFVCVVVIALVMKRD